MSAPWGHVVRRAGAQPALLATVVAVLVVGTTLLGTCALLLTTGQQEALAAAMHRAAPEDVAVTVSLDVSSPLGGGAGADGTGADGAGADGTGDAAALLTDVDGFLTRALAPLGSTTSTWVQSTMLALPAPTGAGGDPGTTAAQGYLESADDVDRHATLTSGRWPVAQGAGGPRETAVPAVTAGLLGLRPGSEIALTRAAPTDGTAATTEPAVTLVVVGIFDPARADTATWDRDVLGGAGFHPSWERPGSGGWVVLPTYGPFLVDQGVLLGGATAPDDPARAAHLSLVTRPDLDSVAPGSLDAVRAALDGAAADLAAVVGDRGSSVHLGTSFPRSVADAQAQQRVTRSVVLVLALTGVVLGGAALSLAGILVTGRRRAETALLSARGAGRLQLGAQSAAESVVLAVASSVVAVPLSLASYRGLMRLPVLADAGIRDVVAVTPTLAATVVLGSLVLVAVLVVPSLRRPDAGVAARRSRRGTAARSGGDLLLVVLAVVGYLQLRDHRVVSGDGADPVLVVAPVLCLVAASTVALRVVPWVARLAERLARRSRGLVMPLAAWEVARRPQATAAVLLLVLGTAAATFGVSFDATWSHSQRDQAQAQVGAQLSVDLAAAPVLAQGRALVGALDETSVAAPPGSSNPTVAPVTDRPVTIGTWSGVVGDKDPTTPRLVAMDAARADTLLPGRQPDGTTWASLTAGLTPSTPVPPVPIASDATGVRLVVAGTGSLGGRPLVLTPSVVVQDEWGARATVEGGTASLDGLRHEVALPFGASALPMAGRLTVVGVSLRVTADAAADVDAERALTAPLTVTVEIPGTAGTAGTGADWSTSVPPGDLEPLTAASADAERTSGATVVTATMTVALYLLPHARAEVMLTPFETAGDLPVVVSRDLATATGSGPGATLGLTVGTAEIQARVVAVTDYVPSAPGRPAVLADEDALSRAVLGQVDHESVVDRWWVTGLDDEAAAASAVGALGVGTPVTAAGTAHGLLSGPLRVEIRAAVWLLVAAAAALVLTGTALHTAAATEVRATEVARLLGLGVPRRALTVSLVAQHAVVHVLVVAVGAVVGGAVSLAVGPLLAVSRTGEVPVPAPLAQWPWPEEGVLLAGILVAGVAVVVPVVRGIVRRAGAARLRMGDAS